MSNDEVAAQWVKTNSLKPWKKNPRHNHFAIERVAESINTYGFGAPIVARLEDRRIIAGHTRFAAARRLKLKKVPVRFMDVTEEEANRLALADNKLGELSSWNDDLLAEVMGEMRREDVLQLGWGTRELDRILSRAATPDELTSTLRNDAVADSRVGEMYELGAHRLLCGDSMRPENMAKLLGDDAPFLWFFDPPFDFMDHPQAWTVLPSVQVAVVWWRGRDGIRWQLDEFSDRDWVMHDLVFLNACKAKPSEHMPSTAHGNVFVWRKKWWTKSGDAMDRDVLRMSGAELTRDGRHFSVQTVNSAETMRADTAYAKTMLECEIGVAYSKRESVILDACAGSGTTLLATAKHGRVWRGAEILPSACDVIRRRWTKYATTHSIDPGPGALAP